MNKSDSRQHSRRLRFSLLNALLMMTIVALGVCLVVSARRNAQLDSTNQALENQNLRYRSELGIIDVKQPEKIHAIQLPSDNNAGPNEYRVYLPPGRTYAVKSTSNDIPKTGVPTSAYPREIAPGEYIFRVTISHPEKATRDGRSQRPQVHVLVSSVDKGRGQSLFAIGSPLREEQNDWIDNEQTGGGVSHLDQIGRDLELLDADEPLVLYRLRAAQPINVQRSGAGIRYSTQQITEPCDGFMLWIEESDFDSGS